MSGMARMNGIPYRPKDKVPAVHGGSEMSDIRSMPPAPVDANNQPEPVVYDKNGIVYPKDTRPQATQAVEPDTNVNVPAYGSQYYSDKSATPQVTNAKTVSIETAAEARAKAKARKAKAK